MIYFKSDNSLITNQMRSDIFNELKIQFMMMQNTQSQLFQDTCPSISILQFKDETKEERESDII